MKDAGESREQREGSQGRAERAAESFISSSHYMKSPMLSGSSGSFGRASTIGFSADSSAGISFFCCIPYNVKIDVRVVMNKSVPKTGPSFKVNLWICGACGI